MAAASPSAAPARCISTAALLQANPKATEADIAAEITNICRCGTYARVKTAILDVVAGGTLGRG